MYVLWSYMRPLGQQERHNTTVLSGLRSQLCSGTSPPQCPCSCTVYTWAVEVLLYHDCGLYALAILVRVPYSYMEALGLLLPLALLGAAFDKFPRKPYPDIFK